MKIQCPQCAVIGSVDDSYRGKKVKCPKCSEIFVVIGELQAIPTSPLDLAPPPPPPPAAGPEPAAVLTGEPERVVSETISAEQPVIHEAETLSATEIKGDDLPEETAVNRTSDEPSDAASDVPVSEPEETIDWSDIVSEMDKERSAEETRGREEEFSPAGFNQGPAATASPTGIDFDEEPSADSTSQKTSVTDSPVNTEQMPPGIAVPLAAATAGVATLAGGGGGQPEPTEKIVLDGVEQRPYGMEKEQCWQCGKKDSVGMPFIAKDGRLYCPDCLPAEAPEPPKTATAPRQPHYGFTIGGLVREAWAKTKGVKGAIWAGSAIMYLAMIIIVAGGALLLPQGGDTGWNPAGMAVDLLFQLLTNAVMIIFSAGLINIGIRKVAGEPVGWRMVFDGFPVAGNLIVAGILQSLLIMVGFLLLILPGIYLSIGYCMTVPLIVDRKMSPWQAMEASRKAVHGEWWKVFGLFIVMGLICLLASLPLGLGLIWAWPMFVVLGALVYRALFGVSKKAD